MPPTLFFRGREGPTIIRPPAVAVSSDGGACMLDALKEKVFDVFVRQNHKTVSVLLVVTKQYRYF